MTTVATPLVFVWLGDTAPDYLEAALSMSVRDSGLEVVLVGPSTLVGSTPAGCDFVSLESFYEPIESFENRIASDHEFRDGFWLRTSERFLVLDQFMERAGLDSMMHAELDCLTFGLDELVHQLNSSRKSGIFVPFDRSERCVASILYCNERRSLRALADWIGSDVEFANDMEMLAIYAGVAPASVIALPTVEMLLDPELRNRVPCRSLSVQEIGGVVDAASLGQWVAGIDPRNLAVGRLHLNHFINPESIGDPERFRGIEIQLDEGSPFVDGLGISRLRLYSLHLHSKIHPAITSQTRLERLLRRSRRRRRSIVSFDVWSYVRLSLRSPVVLGRRLRSRLSWCRARATVA